MNLRDLHYLILLAEHRHFGNAAKAANVSQPTLSTQIRKLEDELGVSLFERDNRNVAPTPQALPIIEEARMILRHESAIRDIAAMQKDPLSGDFHLGVIASLSPYFTPDLLDVLNHDAPRMTVHIQEDLTDNLITALTARKLDAIIIASEPEEAGLMTTGLFEEPFYVAMAHDHPLASQPHLTLKDIDKERLLLLEEGHCLRDQALEICMIKSVDNSVRATSLTTLIRLVSLGRGITLLPALASRFANDVVMKPLRGRTASRHVFLAYRRNFPRIGALNLIAETSRRIASDSQMGRL